MENWCWPSDSSTKWPSGIFQQWEVWYQIYIFCPPFFLFLLLYVIVLSVIAYSWHVKKNNDVGVSAQTKLRANLAECDFVGMHGSALLTELPGGWSHLQATGCGWLEIQMWCIIIRSIRWMMHGGAVCQHLIDEAGHESLLAESPTSGDINISSSDIVSSFWTGTVGGIKRFSARFQRAD